MKIKIYPIDQIKQYLMIDVISIVFLFYIVLSSGSDLGILGKLFLLLIFLVSFYSGIWYRDWRLLMAVLIGLLILALLSIYVGLSILIFGFIFADLIGRSKSKWHIGIGMVAIALMFILVLWKSTGHLFKLESTTLLPLMIIQIFFPLLIYIKEKAKSLQSELDEANKQIVQQEERQRIARDLHDTLGQTLTMIKLKSELTTRLVDKDSSKAKEELKEILATTRIALKQVRELVSDMKFVSLESEIEHSKKLMHTAGIELDIVKKGDPLLLSSVEETMIALCIREAMTNIIKHSKAKRCTIQFEIIDQIYFIQIKDDGIGLVKVEGGNGIQSMKERMQALQGTAAVNNSPSGGTHVSIKLPVRQ
ncbi:sensor histidine kinase [Neobacillus drentensis]|uniref:sensor histidine kinase n=1 Tax=Neobacillus drentensis TaxID=220684 RepID=UPI002FFD8A5F